MRGLSRARVEIGLATMAYNIRRITNVLGAANDGNASSSLIERSDGTLNLKC
jgi:hypothetical protein